MAKSTAHQGIPIIGPILNKLIGTRNERFVKRYLQRVDAINALDAQTRTLTDAQLKAKVTEFRERVRSGTDPESLLPEAFAIAREAMDRAVGIRNIFNPAKNFDPGLLPESVRGLYQEIRAKADALAPAAPTGEYLGCSEPVPGWMQVEIPNEMYDAVRSIYPESRPPFRARPFDVQLIGGMVIYNGKISEMKTGEGKTIVGPLACYLASIAGHKVHVVTVNDYLVQRDRDWTFPYFWALGMTVGSIHPQHMQGEDVKRRMYECDVVYGTTSEFGFDYLRDNMKRREEDQVQKFREFAIVDEVDSILIDEARTPLIISGPAHSDAPRYDLADKLARHLVEKQRPWQAADDRVQATMKLIKGLEGDIRTARDKSEVPGLTERLRQARLELPGLERERDKHVQYYEFQPERKQAYVTHEGIAEAQKVANIGSFYVGENMDMPHLLEQSVRAHVVFLRDRDYIVMPTENPQTGQMQPSVVIVDTFTGRPMIGRQWSDGLHQAVEAKEAVPIKQETQTVATVTIQNFFKMYKRLSGMTGTADTEAQEFHDIYQLDVVAIPTNRNVVRRDFDDLMYLREKDKWTAIVDEIKAFHDVGRPVLVGTTSVEHSEMLSKMLSSRHGVKHEVLNAKPENIEREAHIVENAGQLGQVMIATNMAGRGTDIKLGPASRASLLDHWLRRGLAPRTLTVDSTEDQLREAIYRKIAPGELELNKRETDEMAFDKLELMLLRKWAGANTWLGPKQIERASAEELRAELDATGRFLLHRVRWFDNVEDMGGLHVIGTERHESRRIDNQLRGRSGRQGDKGSSRFYVSLEDDLMKLFAGDRTMKLLSTLGMKEGDAIEHPMLSKSVERAQRKVEERNFQVRKNILEYDEVMEHQRQSFYGLRQRVLEGRDVRGLIFDYIRASVDDAVALYLGPDYPTTTAAEFATSVLDVPIAADRLKGRSGEDLLRRIRSDAKDEARQAITTTLGEYIPDVDSEVKIDLDAEGLAKWARTHLGIELDTSGIAEGGTDARRGIERALAEASDAKIDAADLSGVEEFTKPDYAASELARWADQKFGIKVDPQEILRAQPSGPEAVAALFLKQAEELYRVREVEYPVDFAMDITMATMRQSPQYAIESLCRWANTRFGLNWTPEKLRTTPPQQARQELLNASAEFVKQDRIRREIEATLAVAHDDAKLGEHLKQKLSTEMTPTLKRLRGKDREDAVRARVESVMRSELLYFERSMLLDTLDDSWKEHLYGMDQLRGAISFRAFSQQDPRIEFKREGSKLFGRMMETVRDRVTDHVFKVRISPVAGMQAAPRPAARPAPMSAAPAAGPMAAAPAPAAMAGGSISGPGLDVLATAAAPAAERHQRDLEAAQRAGTPGAGAAAAKPSTVVKTERRLGRNDPCPQNSGRKYKKCCNRPDGTCTGEGLTRAPSPDDGTD
jgi:preprotein translocase subunit SecA